MLCCIPFAVAAAVTLHFNTLNGTQSLQSSSVTNTEAVVIDFSIKLSKHVLASSLCFTFQYGNQYPTQPSPSYPDVGFGISASLMELKCQILYINIKNEGQDKPLKTV